MGYVPASGLNRHDRARARFTCSGTEGTQFTAFGDDRSIL